MNSQKGFAIIPIIIIVVVLIAGGVGGYIYLKNKNVNKPVACTQEAKQCPDGSYIGRVGPKCEFAECPSVTTTTQQATNTTQNFNQTTSTQQSTGTQNIADETANWNTYRNIKHGFEFKYPQDYKIGKGTAIYSVSGQLIEDLSSGDFPLYYKDKIETTFWVFSKEIFPGTEEDIKKFGDDCSIIDKKTKKYGEAIATYYEVKCLLIPTLYEMVIPLGEDKIIFLMGYFKPNEEILSTFKFIK